MQVNILCWNWYYILFSGYPFIYCKNFSLLYILGNIYLFDSITCYYGNKASCKILYQHLHHQSFYRVYSQVRYAADQLTSSLYMAHLTLRSSFKHLSYNHLLFPNRFFFVCLSLLLLKIVHRRCCYWK